jgi:hypothetical protein
MHDRAAHPHPAISTTSFSAVKTVNFAKKSFSHPSNQFTCGGCSCSWQPSAAQIYAILQLKNKSTGLTEMQEQ